MKFKRFNRILGPCGLMLFTYPIASFSWSCDSDCNITGAFGIPDLVAKASCEAYKGLNCGIKIPTIEDIINDTRKTIESLTNIACARPFESYVSGVYNACINGSDGFSDIVNAPRNIQLAAAILTELKVYKREDFNNVKIMWCDTISAGADGMAPAPDRILMVRGYRDVKPYNDAFAFSDGNHDYLPGGVTALLAHEMTHIQQIRGRGFENFSCNYSTEMLKHGGTGEGNMFEKEAYDRQRYVNKLLSSYIPTKSSDQLINDFLNPPVVTPPSQAQISGVLTAINEILLSDEPCVVSAAPVVQPVPHAGGTNFAINITAPSTCSWGSKSNVPWLTISSGASGQGNGVISYTVGANDAYVARSGSLTVAAENSQSIKINQGRKPGISISNVAVTEGASGTSKYADFKITLNTKPSAPVSVTYATQDGTAKAGSDYQATTGTLTFSKGQTSKIVSVRINGDNIIEREERFRLTLSNSTSDYSLIKTNGACTIKNDD